MVRVMRGDQQHGGCSDALGFSLELVALGLASLLRVRLRLTFSVNMLCFEYPFADV